VNHSVWLLLVLFAAGPLGAQTVVRPEPTLDSAQVTLRDAILGLRDSLATIDGAAARLQRDYRATSGSSLVSRARVMRDACARSIRTIPPTRQAVLDAQLATRDKIRGRDHLVVALDTLQGALRWCETEFAALSKPEQAERIRDYGNDRAVKVLSAIRRYEQSMRDFMGLIGIPLTPLGAPASALSG
jgi:hypothetical protein